MSTHTCTPVHKHTYMLHATHTKHNTLNIHSKHTHMYACMMYMLVLALDIEYPALAYLGTWTMSKSYRVIDYPLIIYRRISRSYLLQSSRCSIESISHCVCHILSGTPTPLHDWKSLICFVYAEF